MKACGRPVNADKLTPFARNLKAARLGQNITQAKAAQHLGYSIFAYRKWEQGFCEPGIQALRDICTFFGVSPNQLLDWKGETNEI